MPICHPNPNNYVTAINIGHKHKKQFFFVPDSILGNERNLVLVAVLIVYSYKRADEGEDFTEGNEDGGVDDADGRKGEGGGEQCAPEDAHCYCCKKLENGFLVHYSCRF